MSFAKEHATQMQQARDSHVCTHLKSSCMIYTEMAKTSVQCMQLCSCLDADLHKTYVFLSLD